MLKETCSLAEMQAHPSLVLSNGEGGGTGTYDEQVMKASSPLLLGYLQARARCLPAGTAVALLWL